MRRNSTFGVRGAGAFEHDGSDPISSIGNSTSDVYVDTDTAGDGSDKRVIFNISSSNRYLFAATSAFFTERLDIQEGASTETLRLSGDSIAKTSAPSRGVVSRDNICFAWGQFFVNIGANTASLTEGHNVDAVTWVSDAQVTITFHNATSSSNIGIVLGNNVSGNDPVTTSPAATGFTFSMSSTPGANWTGYFAVFTKDLT